MERTTKKRKNLAWLHIQKCYRDVSNLAKFYGFITKVNNSLFFWSIKKKGKKEKEHAPKCRSIQKNGTPLFLRAEVSIQIPFFGYVSNCEPFSPGYLRVQFGQISE